MDFKKQYKHPLWQKKRLEIMEAAGFKCYECGTEDVTLNVHHIKYEIDLKVWEYPDDYYRCLCESCHKKHHQLDSVFLFETRGLSLEEKTEVFKLLLNFKGIDHGKD